MYVFNYQFLLSDLFCMTSQLTFVSKTILVHVSQYFIISKFPHLPQNFQRLWYQYVFQLHLKNYLSWQYWKHWVTSINITLSNIHSICVDVDVFIMPSKCGFSRLYNIKLFSSNIFKCVMQYSRISIFNNSNLIKKNDTTVHP